MEKEATIDIQTACMTLYKLSSRMNVELDKLDCMLPVFTTVSKQKSNLSTLECLDLPQTSQLDALASHVPISRTG